MTKPRVIHGKAAGYYAALGRKGQSPDTSEYWERRLDENKRKRSLQIKTERLKMMHELKPGRNTVRSA